ncbi:TolC family protein [Weeksella virosa]|uniref:TolC family protein n=1 Tax=Weeksella virosa TaxID=1014 RepID=UPI002553A4D2|nr:TolC family protein [Weeksella virosa]MDK7375756.1 TolC family protein [Weeksella virosa]
MKFWTITLAFLGSYLLQAQDYTKEKLLQEMLQNNAHLIAEKYSIDVADAEKKQAGLRQNPTFSIQEVNLWKNGSAEELPHLFGNYGKHQQVSLELEQVIETAAKRKKRVAAKEIEKKIAQFSYEELLNELTFSLQEAFVQLQQLNKKTEINQSIIELYQTLAEQYKRQSTLRNVSKADYLRIQTALVAYQQEDIELQQERTEILGEIRTLTNLPNIELKDLVFEPITFDLTQKISLQILDDIIEKNPTLKTQSNRIELAKQQISVEKAEAKPDLQFQVSYDRGGSIMRDFVGIGLSFDLPVFNRNQGQIQAAHVTMLQEEANEKSLKNTLINRAKTLMQQLIMYENLLKEWQENESDEQTEMIANYRKNLQSKQITLVEFIDFIEAYQDAQMALQDLSLSYQNTFLQLQYLSKNL